MKKTLIILIAILMVFCLLSCDQKISHAEHVWGGQKVTKEATCTEEGEAIVKCACGETKTITLEKLGHDIVEEVTEPTYLKKGRIDYKCSRCDATDLKKSIEFDRLSLAGYGFEKLQTFETDCSYDWILFGEDNRVQVIAQSFETSSVPIVMSFMEFDYLIREKKDAEGNYSYFLSVSPYEYQISEENGELIISDYLYNGKDYADIKLEKGVHEHSGVIKNYVSDEDIANKKPVNRWNLCQYFECDCEIIKDKTIQFIVHDQHWKGSDGKCVYCGATLS